MGISTPLFVIFGLNVDVFLAVVVAIILVLVVVGIILMVRNVRPITGFLLLILAMAMIIGISYDYKSIKKELGRTIERFAK